MKKMLMGTALLIGLSSPAFALTEPQPSPRDPRLVNAVFTDDIIAVHATVGQPYAIEFCKGESADNSVWISIPNGLKTETDGELLLLMPTKEIVSQPIIAYAKTATGYRRRVVFELDVKNPDRDEKRPFSLKITCPDIAARERQIAAEKWREEHPPGFDKAVSRIRQSSTGFKNDHYVGIGDSNLLPSMSVWDDGQQTFLRFPGNSRIPNMYVLTPDGSESVAPYSVGVDGTITLNQVVKGIRLRDGDSALCIWNKDYNPVGINPGTGTTSRAVLRTVRNNK